MSFCTNAKKKQISKRDSSEYKKGTQAICHETEEPHCTEYDIRVFSFTTGFPINKNEAKL